ncbi:MAG: 5'-nucleotidase C-terminal domain-containing protein [Crocinitomicaceae bacterium]|nr:5'-nucleotidase C-terminal domain-containing protein [Crocinitomicaceae bacterium]
MVKYISAIIIGAGLLACSSVKVKTDSNSIEVVASSNSENIIDSLISPYKDSLESEMLEVLAYANQDFVKGRPSGSLNNWSADVILQSQIRNTRLSAPTFCLLNVGGLRNTINKGDVTLGDIYKVMPFDNEIVWVEMPIECMKDIEAYLKNSGGEPIAGAHVENGELKIDGVNDQTKKVWVITSDYLMNGGDRMVFFEKRISARLTGLLMRDAMINEAKLQGVLVWSDENRIVL